MTERIADLKTGTLFHYRSDADDFIGIVAATPLQEVRCNSRKIGTLLCGGYYLSSDTKVSPLPVGYEVTLTVRA
jgi:hypothetical protein